MLKNEYLEAVRGAGFSAASVISETHFPAESILADPAAQAVIQGLSLPPEKIAGMVNSIVSITVTAEKPVRAGA